MKSSSFHRVCLWGQTLAVLFVLAFAESTANAQVLYQQVFGNSSGGYASLSGQGIDWKSYFTTWNWALGVGWAGVGLAGSASLTTTDDNFGVALPANATSLTMGKFTTSGGAQNQMSLYTTSLTLDPASYGGLQFSWYQQGLTDYTRVLIRVGTVWYLSVQQFVSPTLSQQTFTYTADNDSWLVLGTGTGSNGGTDPYNANVRTLSTVAAADLTGPINAFGLYMDTASANYLSVDTFAVTAIPEPSAALSLGVGLVGWIALTLRRKHASA
ncbi:MAG: hypothetical protein B9S32_00085 [Verrucomicrobia bacterium Tous-C9LFEB]|nr:MAG: hypothetical protein B9S32_00085 [Verrucomicrobia bacterium Tous-C9LFEB]